MFNTRNKQYILKQSSGKLWNIFYDERRGLQHSTLTNRNTWVEPVTIHKNIFSKFCAQIDDKDSFHILFQDKKGSIFYTRLADNDYKTLPILNSKTPSTYDKHLNIIPLGNTLHFFYVLQYKDSYMLAHQTMTENRINQPKIIDYVSITSCPYSVDFDSKGTLYVFYQTAVGENYQIGYKRLMAGQSHWDELIHVSNYEGGCQFPNTLIDKQDRIHLCYQRRAHRQYELIYRQMSGSRNWSDEIVIHSSAYPFNGASLLWINDSIIVYWVKDEYIYYSISKDGGSYWSKPTQYNFPAGRQLMRFAYSTNVKYEQSRITVKDIPGNFANGVTFAFYQEVAQQTTDIAAQELKNTITDSLKMTKDTLERIQKIDSILENQGKEIVKLTLKMGLLENEINRLKTMDTRVESYQNKMFSKNLEIESSEVNEIRDKPDEGNTE